ncbi:MAG: NfeD family protein [Pyrinomonadaceae bacterium]
MLFIGLAFIGVVMVALLSIAILSRRHKKASGELNLIGRRAFVVTPLCPEGSIMLNGELWLARVKPGKTVSHGTVVIESASDHFLNVEPLSAHKNRAGKKS